MSTRAEMLSGIVADQADWRAREAGYWPHQSVMTAPVWHVESNGKWSRVSRLHETPDGSLWQATGTWGRTVPCGRP